MIKVLFLIHDLGQGGAEKVLVNLVNHLDKTKFSISVISIFAGGVNEQFLSQDIQYYAIFKKSFPGNSRLMKLLSPQQLHALFVKDEYDIEISYLEGPCARIISGCSNKSTKIVSWIHSDQSTRKKLAASFRNFSEAKKCYTQFDRHVFVAEKLRESFCKYINISDKSQILFNTIETNKIRELSKEKVEIELNTCFSMVAVGSLKEVKGYDRLLNIAKRLKECGKEFKLIILGIGPLEKQLKEFIRKENLTNNVFLLGYDTNPYKYVSKCDLYVCSSYSEGFSTSTTEALLVGTAVCTVDVSGMKEMLGENEYGVITENSEDSLFAGILRFIEDKEILSYYKKMAQKRGDFFSLENTVQAVECLLESLKGDS